MGTLWDESYCPHFVDREVEPQWSCLSLFKCSTGPDDLSVSVLLFFKATPVSSSPGSSAPYLPPSQCDVCLLCIHRTLYVTSLGITIISLVQYLGIPLYISSTPQQLQFTDLVVLPVEFKDKEVQRHGESCCSRGSLLGETGMGVEKVGWDLLGMSEELEKYYQQLSQLSVAASLWSGILYIL